MSWLADAYKLSLKVVLLTVQFVLPTAKLSKSVSALQFTEQSGTVICLNSVADYQRFVSVLTYFLVVICFLIFGKLFDDVLDATPFYLEFYILLYTLLQMDDYRYCKVLYRGVLQPYTFKQVGISSALPKGLQELPRRISFMTPKIRDSPKASPPTDSE